MYYKIDPTIAFDWVPIGRVALFLFIGPFNNGLPHYTFRALNGAGVSVNNCWTKSFRSRCLQLGFNDFVWAFCRNNNGHAALETEQRFVFKNYPRMVSAFAPLTNLIVYLRYVPFPIFRFSFRFCFPRVYIKRGVRKNSCEE